MDAGPQGRKPRFERVLRNGKRMYVQGFKLALVRRCLEPGVSVSAVALEHGINANLLRKWTDKHRDEARVRDSCRWSNSFRSCSAARAAS